MSVASRITFDGRLASLMVGDRCVYQMTLTEYADYFGFRAASILQRGVA